MDDISPATSIEVAGLISKIPLTLMQVKQAKIISPYCSLFDIYSAAAGTSSLYVILKNNPKKIAGPLTGYHLKFYQNDNYNELIVKDTSGNLQSTLQITCLQTVLLPKIKEDFTDVSDLIEIPAL